MQPRIEIIENKKLIGQRMKMSYADYKIGELWKKFMPRRKEIKNNLNSDLISLVVYCPTHFIDFKSTNEFERWATVEVEDYSNIPLEMERFDLQAGLYAVFEYKGLNTDHSIFQYIYQDWLINSDFELDDRPHFEVLGEKYKNSDVESEEEIWIPIKQKK